MKSLLYITYYWPPSGGPGVQRSLKFTRYLPQFGYIPSVITVDPKWAYYPLLDTSLEKEIPDYIKVYKTKTREPFRFYNITASQNKLPKPGFAGEGKPGFSQVLARTLRGNLFIPDPRKGWNKFLIAQALELIKQDIPAAIVTSSPPHSTQLAGLKLKQRTKIPWMADLRDPWTDIYYYDEFRHLPWIKHKDAQLELSVLENADAILVVSPSIKNLFLSKSAKISEDKIHVIPNGFDDEDFNSISNQPKNESFTITYTGTLSTAYNIDALIHAVKHLKNSNPNIKIHIQFIGKISPEILQSLKNNGLENMLSIIDYLPHREAITQMMAADVLLLAIPKINENKGILTGKLFEYMATGNPILGIGPPDGDASKILDETHSGIMFDYDQNNEVLSFLRSHYEIWQKGDNLRRSSPKVEKYSRKALTAQLAQIIDQFAR